MRRFWDERTLYLLLSVGIAVVAWLYVATAQNPVVVRTLRVDVELRNLEPSEVVIRPSPRSPAQVTVRLQGPRSQIALLTPKLVDASVDLSGLEPGEHSAVPVVVTSALDVRVVEQKPTSLLVVLDSLTSKRMPVEVSLLDAPPEGVALGGARTMPASVTVSGPSRQVAQVRHAIVYFDTASVRQQVVASVQVVPADPAGQTVTGVAVSPASVAMTLSVRQAVISKVVSVVPTLVGTPPPQLAVSAATAEPGTVTLTGPSAVLQNAETAATMPVDVTGARADFSRRVPLQLPPGISASVGQVAVSVRVGREMLSTVFKDVPVRVVDVPAGTASRLVPDHVAIQVVGPQDLVRGLTAQVLTIEVSAAGLGPGQHPVSPRVILPQGVRVLIIQPAQVVMILSPS